MRLSIHTLPASLIKALKSMQFTLPKKFGGNPVYPVILITLLSLTGCQNRAPSLRLLDARSGYGRGLESEEVSLYQRGKNSNRSLVRKSAPRVARVYVYPHELPSKDYFWGGYVSLVVTPDEWILESIETRPALEQLSASHGNSTPSTAPLADLPKEGSTTLFEKLPTSESGIQK